MPCGGVNFTAKSDLHVLAYNPGLLRLSVVLHPAPYDDDIILRGGVSDTPFYAQA